jgi:hypothetical protein
MSAWAKIDRAEIERLLLKRDERFGFVGMLVLRDGREPQAVRFPDLRAVAEFETAMQVAAVIAASEENAELLGARLETARLSLAGQLQ